jgi:catalase-peroxidase
LGSQRTPELEKALTALEKIRSAFNTLGNQISMADYLVVLGGCAGVEAAAEAAGFQADAPFTAGRTDTTQDMTDIESLAVSRL